jgi:hypothetical protein
MRLVRFTDLFTVTPASTEGIPQEPVAGLAAGFSHAQLMTIDVTGDFHSLTLSVSVIRIFHRLSERES